MSETFLVDTDKLRSMAAGLYANGLGYMAALVEASADEHEAARAAIEDLSVLHDISKAAAVHVAARLRRDRVTPGSAEHERLDGQVDATFDLLREQVSRAAATRFSGDMDLDR